MLTDAKCRAVKATDKTYRVADSHGLCLEVRPSGAKFWRYRFRLADKQNMHALGEYPAMGLQDARRARDEARELVRKGINPSHHRGLEKAERILALGSTFETVTAEWIERNRPDWSANYIRQVRARMAGDVFPEIGQYPIADLKAAHVLAMLRKVEKRSPTQAALVKTWVGGVFRFAVVEQLREDDPTFPLRRAVKPTQVNHHAILRNDEIGAFLRAIAAAPGEVTVKEAVGLMWATACRINEVTGARWAGIDLDAGLWTIPPGRMKAKQEHVVTLTRQAVEILRRVQVHTGTLEHVFPHRSDRKRPMSGEAVRDLFRRAGYAGKFTPHGVRGTFSTIANGAGWRADVIELCLAHQERNQIRRAYNHAQLLDERRELLQWWGDLSDQAKRGGAGRWWRSSGWPHELGDRSCTGAIR
ncbi:tyrosine-type recombinase/integrase [Aromatoleum aromaticum]|uniref:Phage-related integrase n=1 Tax=Aromatoleum aromaticum (strain DSM 19018 / LMG 30748 / EbN1) TaxID=76114 RepID=Q5P707_AROAE|nr:tyrosine-type recombinase/integrase [Aromatoleum aromaticum]NMG54229.1 tyrosine-type recombinase/integrase [Aromatoleum aromaticum]CAI06904.1 phage-related integrase [Aromatoleum aromaticum EbN1]